MRTTSFYQRLYDEIDLLGGLHNAHLHLDRANTLADGLVDAGRFKVLENSHVSLQKKHSLISTIHAGPAYDSASLRCRFKEIVGQLIECRTRRADSMIDVCDDRTGLEVLSLAKTESQAFKQNIDLRFAAYSPFGFKDSEPARWDVFEAGAHAADFIGALPEADDKDDYPENIGFEEHCLRTLDLARRLGKSIHVHTDQRNDPLERGTERLAEVLLRDGTFTGLGQRIGIWAVHAISPSTYSERAFQALLEKMQAAHVGVICCPSAAIGMRQFRPLTTPTYNCFPRLLEMAAAGIPIRLGSDNIADLCSPSTTADLVDEVFILSAALRFYFIPILAKFACGVPLNHDDRLFIQDHLQRNDQEIATYLSKRRT